MLAGKGVDKMEIALLMAAGGTGFTFLMTALGSAVVLVLGHKVGIGIQRAFFGFAAGIMLAASVFSLLLPAIERAEGGPVPGPSSDVPHT